MHKRLLFWFFQLGIFLAAMPEVQSQNADTSSFELGLYPKNEPDVLRKITVSGFYRFFATYTQQYEPYILNPVINDTVLPNSLFIGDDSQLPNFQLNIAGRPNDKTSWSFDVYAFQFLNGNINETYGEQITDSLRPSIQDPISGTRLGASMLLNLGINFTGSHETRYGTFTVRAGGIQWANLSDLTLASFRGYNRFTLFERNPWDPAGAAINSRYASYYEEGAINQDTRWGNRAFKGLILDGVGLPDKWSFSALAGKSEFNGGFSTVPSFSYGGKLKKALDGEDFVSFNTFNSSAWADSLALDKAGFQLATLEISKDILGFNLHVEGGSGQYFSPNYSEGWGGLVSASVTTPEQSGIPKVNLHYFYISPKVINNNAVFLNTAITEYNPNEIPAGSIGSSAVLQPFGSSMLRLGQMANNRQGLNMNVEYIWKDFHFSIGMGAVSELEPIANTITYSHPVNQLTRSRMWRWVFPPNVGPYGHYSDIYRDGYETVQLLDDSSGITVNKKYFNVLEPQIKYHTKFIDRNLYLFYLGYYSTVQREWSPWLVTTEEAYIRQYATEFELYYQLTDILMLCGYAGIERTLGNYLTDINEETRRPRNQTGTGYGAGVDIDLGRNANLYLRNRWFYFEDVSFPLDKFKGQETMVELKIFF
jgi:hypothetical protein